MIERITGTPRRALDRIIQEFVTGLRHGFFEMTISSEIVNGKKRKLTIKAGKSHCYTVNEAEIP
ncbi:hypothetical protein ACFL2P_01665 [Candidatus Moduliflexota bacterium]